MEFRLENHADTLIFNWQFAPEIGDFMKTAKEKMQVFARVSAAEQITEAD